MATITAPEREALIVNLDAARAAYRAAQDGHANASNALMLPLSGDQREDMEAMVHIYAERAYQARLTIADLEEVLEAGEYED